LIEIKGIEKTTLSIEEAKRAIEAANTIASEMNYKIPEYLVVIFVEEKLYEKTKNTSPDYIEVEEGILVYNGSSIIIRCDYLSIKLLEKLLLGLLIAFYYNTFMDYGIELSKKILKDRFFSILSSVYV